MIWDDDTIRLLRRLWDEKHSTSEIARRLGCSKNSIVGKAQRLDLESRPSPIRRPAGSYVAPPPSVRRILGPTLPPLPSDDPPPAMPLAVVQQTRVVAPPPPPPTPPVQYLPRSAGRCVFPMWRNNERPKFREDGSALVCGDPIERGAYCAQHAAGCYLGRQWKSEAAA